MKKILSIVLIVFNLAFCFSQENIYLIIKEESPRVRIFRLKTDSIQHNQYIISLYIDKSRIKYSIDNGLLRKAINYKWNDGQGLNLIYQNTNGDNNPILVLKDTIKNTIRYDEMIRAENYHNLLEVLKKFKNVYVIEEESYFDGFYVAKKIQEPQFSVRL